jgi:thiol-disulfide isomerase/thioredoxin
MKPAFNFASVFSAILLGSASTFSLYGQPANDMFSNRIVISGTNVTVTGSNVGATREEPDEPYNSYDAGGASVWWSWTAPGDGTVTISTAGSGFDTTLGLYTGTIVTNLIWLDGNDDDEDAQVFTSKVVDEVSAGETYQISVDGYNKMDFPYTGNIVLSVVWTPAPPPQPAPAWSLPDPYGAVVYSTQFAGKVVILDFWSTWCGACLAGIPDLVALQAKYGNDGLVVIGPNVSWSEDTVGDVIDFWYTFTPSINYEFLMSNTSMEAGFGYISLIPSTFVIDRQNLIQKKYVGTQSYSTLEKRILPLLYSNMRLNSQWNGSLLTLRWPTNAATFTLESAVNLKTGPWTVWPTLPTLVGSSNVVQVPATNAARFFRLRLPL